MSQLTLGELIHQLKYFKPEEKVYFDFCDLVPGGLDSYRGYYDQLALGFKQDGSITVRELIGALQDAIGSVFTGYKGGEFTMTKDTPMWVANYGYSHSTAIVSVSSNGYGARINTACID